MLEVLDSRILLLIFSLLTNIETTKLSDQKKCGDPECETSMSRVQAIKDHIGPDCRFLNFKTGDEIMVHFKLSRTREDLWAGSKGQDFGYFPVDAVRVEDVLTTKEVEVPTKETDFFCLDGGEYIFENEDSIFNNDDEDTEYIPLYTDEDDSEYETLKQREDISFRNEFKEPFSDSDEFDSKSKDLHTVETASYGDSELGYSKTGQDETIQQEDRRSQSLKPVPTQPTWTVSGIAGWLGLGSKQKEEAPGKISEVTGQIIFRRRKLAVTDDSDLKKLNDEDETEPRDSGWFQRSLPDFLNFGSEKSGLGLLHKEIDPETQDSSTITGNADQHGSTIASETRKEGHCESEIPSQNWFNLDLHDVLTFGYSTENKVRREKYAGGTAADQNEELLSLSSQLTETSMDEGSRKPTVESVLHEEQCKENHVQETPGTEVIKTDAEMLLANQHTDFKYAADTSFSTEPTDKLLQSQDAEQDSVSDNQLMENINVKMESGRKNDQSGITNKEKLSGNTPNEKHPLKSDKEPSSQDSAVHKIPPVNVEEKVHTSLKNGQLDLKEKLLRSNPMSGNYTFSNGKEWLFQIILHLNDFSDLIISVFSTMTSVSKKDNITWTSNGGDSRGRNSGVPRWSGRNPRPEEAMWEALPAVAVQGPVQLSSGCRSKMAAGAINNAVAAGGSSEDAVAGPFWLGWRDSAQHYCGLVLEGARSAVAALPENMRPGPDLYGFPWEMVICGAVLAIFTVLLLMCRSYRSVRSRLYVGREKQLASKVAELVEDKCKVLEKLSLCKQEYEELESSLKDVNLLEGLTTTSDIKTAHEELISSNSVLKNEIECLEKELEEEKVKRSGQDDLMAEIQKRMESLENEAHSIQLQVAEAKTTLKVYEISRERLKKSVQDAIAENSHLHESEKQLLQEAEGWGERFSELSEQTKMFESSKADMEEALKNKECQLKSLTECLLKMKDWSCATGEHAATEDNHLNNDIHAETENGEHLDDQKKQTVRKLIHVAKLSACLKSLEMERNQIYSKLTDESNAKEELAERIESLQKEHVMFQSENTHFESEVQKLQQKLKVMTELYQENEMNLHRKLTVEEKGRLQKEEKLSKIDEKIHHAAEELNTYRLRAKDLEEELERTARSYQNQIMSHEKKAHDNWLSARATERFLNDVKKENAHNRQKLTEAEFKYDLLEKDPYALDVPVRPFVREHSPYGPSPMGRPSSETRAFLSPPTLLEGPLRLSPVLPGGGGRGSRGPGSSGIYEAVNERGELNSDRLSDPHRPPSDTGSLSPPWDRDRRIIPPPPGQLYNEQSHLRRPERFYANPPNSGRLSGPADLRSYGMHSFDKADGQVSENNSRMDLSGNEIKDHLNESNMLNVSDQSLPPENESFGPGIVPPPLPLLRAPLMPMDPRGPFLRRGSPFPPVPPSTLYGPREYFPRDFASMPHPPLPMRGPFPVRPFSQYPPPRAGFFPPPPPPPPFDNRNELPAELTQPSTVSSTDHQESHQET